MKRLRLLLAGITALSVIGAAAPAFAYDLIPAPTCENARTSNNGNLPAACQDTQSPKNTLYGPDGLITKIANIIAIIVGIAAVIVIIIAGIQYMVSTGDPTKVNNAKNAIIYAVIGIAVAVFARTLVVFFIGRLK